MNRDESRDLRPGEAPAQARSFGLVMAAVVSGLLVWLLLGEETVPAPLFVGLGLCAVTLALVAVARPRWLRLPSVYWFRLGEYIAVVVNPLIMLLIYLFAVVPIAIVMRLTGHDPLRLRRRSDSESYWIERDPPGPDRSSFDNQF